MTATEKFTAMGFPVAKVLADQAGVPPLALEGLADPHRSIGNSVHVILTAVTLIAALACVRKCESPGPLPPPSALALGEKLDGNGGAAPSRALVPRRCDLGNLLEEVKYFARGKSFKVACRSVPDRTFKISQYPTWERCRDAAVADLVALRSRFVELTHILPKHLRSQCTQLNKIGNVARLTRTAAADFIVEHTVEVPAGGPPQGPAGPTTARLSAMRKSPQETRKDSAGDAHRLHLHMQSLPSPRSFAQPHPTSPQDGWARRVYVYIYIHI